MTKTWSPYQQAVFDAVENDTGHLVVVARAGSGKSTTILEAIRRIIVRACGKLPSILLCAFNKDIERELGSKAPPGVIVKTLHSLGYAAIRARWGSVRVSDTRERDQLRSVLPPDILNDDRISIAKLVGYAKSYIAETDDELRDVMVRHGVQIDWTNYYDRDWKPTYGEKDLFGWVRTVLEQSLQQSSVISFNDMIYIPAKLRFRTGAYNFVFVDETQDLSRGQVLIAMMALGPNGRIVAVGDDRQAIYAFRGADSESIPRLIEELDAKVLKLPVSYRCPRLVANIARRYVPDFETPPDAPDGIVQHWTVDKAKRSWTAGDFVLSRFNAPLVSLCLSSMAAGTRSYIQGRDIGAGLAAMIKKSGAKTVEEFIAWLEEWRRIETIRLEAMKKHDRVDDVWDRVAALCAIAEGLEFVPELLNRIETLFADDQGARVMFSSVHRSKGLEAKRVWLIRETFRPERNTEEENLLYVALTRSKAELHIVVPSSEMPEAAE